MPGPPDFAALDAKATAMKSSGSQGCERRRKAGQSARSKSWVVSLDSGAHELVAAEARRTRMAMVTSCGIGADDIDGEEREAGTRQGNEARSRRFVKRASADGTQRLTSLDIRRRT